MGHSDSIAIATQTISISSENSNSYGLIIYFLRTDDVYDLVLKQGKHIEGKN